MTRYLLIYLVAVNVLGALAVALDKYKAKRGAWRVPEKTLFLWCLLGGCPGVYLMMRLVRHKTKHRRFMLGIPAIFAVQLVLITVYFIRGGKI